ncbi:MAG: NAD(P)-dependent oxidoreductase [Flavobacteriaceae bacterium]|nr:NAD(P)-dependent oxidoreductase [Flavobacteriaceae bacterium]
MILVTGCTGFIGKHLLAGLIKKYGVEHIVAFTSKPIEGCNYLLHNNYDFDDNYFIDNGYTSIDIIIHIGAFIPKSASEVNHLEKSNSNILNTYKLINSNLPNLKKVLFFSTVDIYSVSTSINECTIESPVSLYGSSKLYCEKMLETWGELNKKELQILRIGHVYGPGEETYLKIIPETFRKIIDNEPVTIYGTGEDLRSFIYIDDVIKSALNALELTENIGVVNVVGNQEIAIKDLVYKIIDITKQDIKVDNVDSAAPPRHLKFDNAKLVKYLLQEETPLDIGLKIEYEHYKKIKS